MDSQLDKDHPGQCAGNCPLRIQNNQRNNWGELVSIGHACWATGGHCVPDDRCDQHRADAAEQARMQDELEAAVVDRRPWE